MLQFNVWIPKIKKRKLIDIFLLNFILIIYPLLSLTDYYLTEISSSFCVYLFFSIPLFIVFLYKNVIRVNIVDLVSAGFMIWYSISILIINASTCSAWTLIRLLVIFVTYIYFRNSRNNSLFFYFLFAAGLFQGCLYILQVNNLLPSLHSYYKGTGCFSNPALLSLFCVLAFFGGLYIPVKDHKVIRWLRLSGLIFLFLLIFFQSSRAAWLALCSGIGWVAVCTPVFDKYFTPLKKWNKYVKFFFLISSVIIILYVLYRIRPESVQGRFLIWQIISEACLTGFWFGNGLLEANYMLLQAKWFASHADSSFIIYAGNNIYAFNEFLRIIFEAGCIGLFLFSSSVVLGMYCSFKGKRVANYAGALLISVVVFGLFSYPLSAGLISLITAAVLAVLGRCIPIACRWDFKNVKISKFIFCLALMIGIIFVSREYIQAKKADLLLKQSWNNNQILMSENMQECYNSLFNHPDFMLAYGKALVRSELYMAAIPVLEQSLRLRPHSQLVTDLGFCYQRKEEFQKAGQTYQLAADMVPSHISPHYFLFRLYLQQQDSTKAFEQAEYMVNMKVKLVNTSVLRFRNEAKIYLGQYLHQ